MISHLLFVYICNKYQPVCVQVSQSVNECLQYISKKTGKDIDAVLNLCDRDENNMDDFLDNLDINKYQHMYLATDFYDKFINEQAHPELKGCCKHDCITLTIIQTNADGSFDEQYRSAFEDFQ